MREDRQTDNVTIIRLDSERPCMQSILEEGLMTQVGIWTVRRWASPFANSIQYSEDRCSKPNSTIAGTKLTYLIKQDLINTHLIQLPK